MLKQNLLDPCSLWLHHSCACSSRFRIVIGLLLKVLELEDEEPLQVCGDAGVFADVLTWTGHRSNDSHSSFRFDFQSLVQFFQNRIFFYL